MSDISSTTPVGTGNTAPGLTTATILLFAWAFLTYIVRIWAKLSKSDKWGPDDTAISLSLVAALANIVATNYAVHRGYGNPWPSLSEGDTATIHRALFTSQNLYVIAVGLTRISTSFFTGRFLTRDQRTMKMAHGFTIAFGFWTVASIFIVALRGQLSAPWDTLDGAQTLFVRWLVIEVIGTVIDISTFALCVYFIWGLQMPIGKRLIVSAIFFGRLAILPIIALRLWHLSPSNNNDPTMPAITADIFTQGVLHGACMLASITCLKPFLRPFHGGYFVSTVNSTSGLTGYATGPTKNSKAAYYELSATRKSEKATVTVQSRTVGEEEGDEEDLIHKPQQLALRPDRFENRASVGAGLTRRDDEDLGISKTQAFTVSYD